MIGIADVAARAGVSPATVSRVINGTAVVGAHSRQLVEQAIRDLGYQRNDVAASMRLRTTTTIAGIIPDVTNPFFAELLHGLQAAADEASYLLLLCQEPDKKAGLADLIRQVRRRQISGIVFVGLHPASSEVAELVADTPHVVVDRRLDLPNAAWISTDHDRGAELAVGHLADLGHQNIAYLGGPRALPTAKDRRSSYLRAMAGHGLTVEDHFLATGDFSEEGGSQAMHAILDSTGDVTAVLAGNDLMAIGALAALRERGLRVPRDVSVVGYDGIELMRYTDPPITSVKQPTKDLGRCAGSTLISAIEAGTSLAGQRILLQPSLEVRASTARPRNRVMA